MSKPLDAGSVGAVTLAGQDDKSGPVTVAITQHIKQGKQQAFESWLRGVGEAASAFPGHQGLTILTAQKDTRTYTYIFRFDSYAHLQQWETSPQKDEWIAKLQDIIEAPAHKQMVTGLEYWFQLPGNASSAPPPHYKMALVTTLAIFPLSLLVPVALRPFLHPFPWLLASLLRTCALVGLMTYVVMPLMVRIFARWLFKKPPQ